MTRHRRASAQRARPHRHVHCTRRLNSFQTVCGCLPPDGNSKRTTRLRKSDGASAERRLAPGIGSNSGGKDGCQIWCCKTAPRMGSIARPPAVTLRGELLSTCHCHAFTTCCLMCKPCDDAPQRERRQRWPPRSAATAVEHGARSQRQQHPWAGSSALAQPSATAAADPCSIKPVGEENNLRRSFLQRISVRPS